MSSIDERVVQMKLDNTQFQSGVKSTQSALDSLKKNLNFDGAKKSIDGLNSVSKAFSLTHMATGIQELVSKFSTLNIVGVTALTNIVNKAVNAGTQLAKSLTIDPIKAGFDEYELKMGSIQTILSNTARYGTKLPEVTRNLDALNQYADKTIYNFGDMTKNIGLFTNAGIRVGDATSMIKGFSNEAAASGTSAEGAASAAYQLSQALSAGKVTLMDWRSLQNVGMGNKNMQKGIVDIASAMGTLQKKGVTSKGVMKDFNGSLEKGWLSADVMSTYLKIMAGDMSAAEMKTLGLSKAQIATFKTQQKNAEDAATKVRTFTQLLGTMRESVGSGWSETFDILVGDFNQATKLWTDVNNTLGHIVEGFSKRRNDMLKAFVKSGGRDAVIGGLANAFKALQQVIRPIIDAFRDFFPAATGKQVADLAKNFQAFTKSLIPSRTTMEQLRTIFRAVFGVLSIGWGILKGVVHYFTSLFGVVASGSGGVLALVSSIAGLIVQFTRWVQEGDKIKAFFDMLTNSRTAVLQPLVNFVSKIVAAFGLLFQGNPSGFFDALKGSVSQLAPLIGVVQEKLQMVLDFLNKGGESVKRFFGDAASGASSKFVSMIESAQSKLQTLRDALSFDIDTSSFSNASKSIGEVSKVGAAAASVWDGLMSAFSRITDAIGPISQGIGELFGAIKDRLVEYIKGLDMQDAVALLNTGFFIAMYSMMRKFVAQLSDLAGSFGDILDGLAGAFDQLTSTLKAMQQNIQAGTILKIAVALGVLAVSILILSKINPDDLKKALVAITVLFAQLMATMFAFSKMNFAGGMAKAAAALVLLAVATSILAGAVAKLAGLDWDQLAKGLVGVGGLLASLALFTKFAEANSGGIKQGAGLILLAVAIRLLANSVEKLGSMDTGTLIKGVTALGVMIAALTGMVKLINGSTGMVQAAVGLTILSGALLALSYTMGVYAGIDWGTMIHGLGTMAATLVIVGAAMNTFPKNMPATAAGLLIVSGALIILATALKMMGGMSVEDMATGLLTLTVSLAAIAVALNLMVGALPGAAALIVASGALLILAGVMQILGSMDVSAVGTALLAIAGVLTVLAIAAAVMIPLGPGLAILATSIQALGIAMLLAGAGFALFAGGFAVMAAVGTAGVAVLVAAFTGILNLIPLFMQQIALGLRAFAKVIADSGPVIVNALTTLLLSLLAAIERVIPKAIAVMVKFIMGLLQAIQRIAPQFASTIATIVMSMVNTIAGLVPRIVSAGLRMINGFLKAVGDHVGEIVQHATKIVTNFLNAIGKAVPQIVEAGYKMVLDILEGVTNSVNNNSEAMGRAGGNLAVAIIRGMVNGIRAGIGQIVSAAREMASNALNAAKEFLGIHSPSREFYKLGQYVNQGFRNGITDSKDKVQAAFDGLKKMLQDTMRSSKQDVDALEKKLYKLTHARKKDKKEIKETRAELAQANSELRRSTSAYNELTKNQLRHKNELGQLASKYDAYTAKIKAANDKLNEAKKVQADYSKGVRDQYSKLPDIGADTKVQDFANSLRKKINDTKAYSSALAQLRKLGLSDTMYKELVAKGTDALPFVKELVSTGKSGVTQINTLGKQLDSASYWLGDAAAKYLYKAGVDTAAGLVKGLQSQQKNIEKQMEKIASSMVNAIKKKLGIKSPSREFMKVGKFSAEGVARGLDQNVKMVARSAEAVGHEAINSMRKTLTGLGDGVPQSVELAPVISPILDLTDVQKNASKIDSMLSTKPISVGAAYARASDAAAGLRRNSIDREIMSEKTEPRSVSFTQNITSPKAVSEAEIYRQTKNQISQAKGALTS